MSSPSPSIVVPTDENNSIRLNLPDDFELNRFGFRVGATLGTGTYAKVKSAFSEQFARKVAIKIINRRKAPADFQRHFLPRELAILQQIAHQNIVQVYDIFSYGTKLCIVMELAKTDLLDYIKLIGRLNEDKAKKMFSQLIAAVDYLHRMNIVHRQSIEQKNLSFLSSRLVSSRLGDLKCENVLLDRNFDVKLSDFGIEGERELSLPLSFLIVYVSLASFKRTNCLKPIAVLLPTPPAKFSKVTTR